MAIRTITAPRTISSDRTRMVLRWPLLRENMNALGRGRQQVGRLLWAWWTWCTWWTWWTLWTSVDERFHGVHYVQKVHSVRFTPAARSPVSPVRAYSRRSS